MRASGMRWRQRSTPEQLRRVIVESAVEATHADGGVVIAEDGSFVETGDVRRRRRCAWTSSSRPDCEASAGCSLVGEEFDVEERMIAASLAGQAVVALENARLHQMVERQALVDGLTGLANRRQADASLATELTRAERLGGPVGLILADVDDFKLVNDRSRASRPGTSSCATSRRRCSRRVREIDTAARWRRRSSRVILPGTDLDGRGARRRARPASAQRAWSLVSAEGVPLHVTASFGVAASRADDHDVRSSSRRPTKRSTEPSAQGRIVFTLAPSR